MKRAPLIYILLFIKFSLNTCLNFEKLGYIGDYSQKVTNRNFTRCVVSCDNANGYYATEIADKFNGTYSYHTIYTNSTGEWKPLFKDTIGDLNCQFGCYDSKVLEGEPYFLKATHKSIIATNPRIKYYSIVVECKEGYFSDSSIETDDQKIKVSMKCTRTHLNTTDTYAWSEGIVSKLNCVTGCRRFGVTIPMHQNAFGSKTTCGQVGKDKGDQELVSNCELTCDKFNGYYPVINKHAYILCGSDSKYKSEDLNFFCEQGCKFDENAENYFGKIHIDLICKNEIAPGWYGRCGVSCKEGYVASKRGRMGKRGLAVCRLGRWTLQSVSLRCSKSCNKFPDSCEYPNKCIGENEYGETFCSITSVKTYMPEDI